VPNECVGSICESLYIHQGNVLMWHCDPCKECTVRVGSN